MYLVWCSALLALLCDTSFLVTHGSLQAIPANLDTYLQHLSALVRALSICSIHVDSIRMLTSIEGMFKLPKGHLNLVSKSAF